MGVDAGVGGADEFGRHHRSPGLTREERSRIAEEHFIHDPETGRWAETPDVRARLPEKSLGGRKTPAEGESVRVPRWPGVPAAAAVETDTRDLPGIGPEEVHLTGSMMEAVADADDQFDAPPGWTATKMDSGASEPTIWQNPETGERMIVKKGIFNKYHDLEKEVLASDVFHRIGLATTPKARINNKGTVVVVTHANDAFPGGSPAKNWTVLTETERAAANEDMADPWDAVRLMLGDTVMINVDRNTGNLMVAMDAAGVPHIVPIDHAATLMYDYAEGKITPIQYLEKMQKVLGGRRLSQVNADVMNKALRQVYDEALARNNGDEGAARRGLADGLTRIVGGTIDDMADIPWSDPYPNITEEELGTRNHLIGIYNSNVAELDRQQSEIVEKILELFESSPDAPMGSGRRT